MTDDFVAPDVVAGAHAAARRRGRAARARASTRRASAASRRCSSKGRRRRTRRCWSGRTRQNKLVHFDARRRRRAPASRATVAHHVAPRRTGCAATLVVDRRRAGSHPRRPAATCADTHLALVGPTASGKSDARARRRATRSATSRSSRSTRCRCTAGSTSAPRSRLPRERAAVPHHLIDVADPSEDWSVARFQTRGARRGRRHRGARQARAARRRHRPVRPGGRRRSRSRARTSRCGPSSKPKSRARAGSRPRTPSSQRVDPVAAAARIEPGNARRIVRALEVIRLTGRPFSSFGPGHAVVRRHGVPGRDGRRLAAPRRAGAPHRAARSRRCATPGWSTRSRRCAAHGGLSRTARQAIGYKEVLAHLDGHRAVARRRARRGRPPHPAVRPAPVACGSAAIPASPGWRPRENPCAALPALLALWSR